MVKTLIFVGMPTLLGDQQRNSFQIDWPLCKELPPLVNKSFLNQLPQEICKLNDLSQANICKESQKEEKTEKRFKVRKVKMITDCPHKNKKHYAKNMCADCYSKKTKSNKKTSCGHTERGVFAKNMCLSCYTKAYRASKKERIMC